MAQVQALKNGEIDMFSPQVTTDVVKAAEKVENVEIKTGVEGTYEHIDLDEQQGPVRPGHATAATRRRRCRSARRSCTASRARRSSTS